MCRRNSGRAAKPGGPDSRRKENLKEDIQILELEACKESVIVPARKRLAYLCIPENSTATPGLTLTLRRSPRGSSAALKPSHVPPLPKRLPEWGLAWALMASVMGRLWPENLFFFSR